MQQEEIIQFAGGLDLVTPAISKAPGTCIAAQNYESEARGYARISGYEKYDGQGQPHLASYWLLGFDSGSTQIMDGDTVTGDTSGATGIALYDATATTGTWGGGDAAGTLILYDVSGTFQDDEGLEVSAANVATADGVAAEQSETDDDTSDTYLQAAIEARRALIAAPTGSGSILGVTTYGGVVYCWRNNAGGTAAVMYKATASGWAAQSFGLILDFTAGGPTTVSEGDTITGDISGATATVERIVLQSGAWADSDAAGYMVLSGQTGTFQAEDLNTGNQTIAGDSSAITLPAGGTYRTVEYNFYGTSNLNRIYFVNGAGYAHEWDGTVLAPIKITGLTSATDKPQYIGVHSNHLLLGYPGGTVLHSGTGLPLSSVTTDGAGEVNLGVDLTGIVSQTRTATVIAGRTKIGYLTGSDSTDFVLKHISEESGAIADTMVAIGEIRLLDDRGVRKVSATQDFGDFQIGTDTRMIEPIFKNKRASGTTPVGAMRVKAKDQYRLFYDDKTVLNVYYGRKTPETMPLLLDFTPSCVFSAEDANGNEILLAGSTAGMVYRLDVGASADGAEIEAFIVPAFSHQGYPNQEKRYHRCLVGVEDGGRNLTLYHTPIFSYGSDEAPEGIEETLSIPGNGGFWDISNWDEFTWDAGLLSEAYADLNGIGKNISNAIAHQSTYEEPHVVTTVAVYWTPRRKRR